MSATLEQALKARLSENQAKKWQVENKNTIEAYNDFVDEYGCFSDEFRAF